MKIYQLIVTEFDIGCGRNTQILATIKNKNQLEKIALTLNKKYKKPGDIETINFKVEEIDTTKVIDTLTRNEIKKIW